MAESSKETRYFCFWRKSCDTGDKWPSLKQAIEENFPSLLNEDEIVLNVVSDNGHEVRFSVNIEPRNFYSFGTLYDLFLRTHGLNL